MKLRDRTHSFAIVFVLLLAASVQAQHTVGRPSDQAQARQKSQADLKEGFRDDFIKASEEYKASLQKLLVVYQNDVTKLTEHSANWKELYAKGLISRLQYEGTTGKIAEARARVEELGKEIANADIAVAAARQPPQLEHLRSLENTVGRPAPSWTTGDIGIDELIHKNGKLYGVDPYLIFCVVHQESRFRSSAVSLKGARGLMQLMPGTAARYGVLNAHDPRQNIMGGTRYLRDLLQLFGGRVDLALAGYNAGEGAVLKYGRTIPPYKETRNYVRLIGLRYRRIPNATAPVTFPTRKRRQQVRRFTVSKRRSGRGPISFLDAKTIESAGGFRSARRSRA